MKKQLLSLVTAMTMTAAMTTTLLPTAAETGMPANPLISRDLPAYSGTAANANYGNDAAYYTFWNASGEDYLAYDLSSVPAEQRKQVLAVWYNQSSFANIGSYGGQNGIPVDYTIEVNAAEGGTCPTDGWEVTHTMTDNALSSFQHLVDMEGYNWIRIHVTEGLNGQVSFNFDIHDASQGVYDSWLFLGDSITAGGMNNCYGTGYATHLNQIDSSYFPVQQNGGIGGLSSYHGSENIDSWLKDNPVKYVCISYGTNDAWGNHDNVDRYYESTKYMIDAVLAQGKIPVLPTIPYATNADVGDHVGYYNAKVEQLYEEYGDALVHGPDFYAYFEEHPEYLSSDGVHLSSEGYDAMRKYWAETMYATVYQNAPASTETTAGDVNADGSCTVLDAVMLQKWLLGAGEITDWQAGDLNADKKLNGFDLCMLKRMLME